MTVLSAQSIRNLCFGTRPLITPFTERGVVNGKSYGLSGATYDCRIGQDLELAPGQTALASTIEAFYMPHDVCGLVLDKSSYARVFLGAFNTFIDPGFRGGLTLELVNLGTETVTIKQGDPICQIRFDWLDEPTDRPYVGKYQNQISDPQPAIYEKQEVYQSYTSPEVPETEESRISEKTEKRTRRSK